MEEQAEPAHRVPEARELLTVAGWLLSAHGWKEEFVEKKRCYYDQDGKRIGGYKSLHKLLRRDPKLCADYFAYREEEQRKADAAAAAAATTKKAATKAPAKAKTVASTTSKKVKAAGPSKPAKAQPKPAVLSSNRASSSSSSQQPKGRAELEDVILLDEEEEDDDEVDLGELGLTLETFGEDPVLANAINTSRLVGELWRELMGYDNRLTSRGEIYYFKENGGRTEVSSCSDIPCSTDRQSFTGFNYPHVRWPRVCVCGADWEGVGLDQFRAGPSRAGLPPHHSAVHVREARAFLRTPHRQLDREGAAAAEGQVRRQAADASGGQSGGDQGEHGRGRGGAE
jgi:hypothetical protein